MILPDLGRPGQEQLQQARVAIVGAGGLGCPTALYLANAGVGHLKLIDSDHVELSNLHRQVLHTSESIGEAKVKSAQRELLARNPSIQVEALRMRIDISNIKEILEGVDVVVDGSDNMPTRYLLNDYCILHGKTLVSGSAIGTCGQVSVFGYQPPGAPRGPCYRCLFPKPSTQTQSCSDNGVLGPVTGQIGTLQAMETIKVLCSKSPDEVLSGRLLMVDLMSATFHTTRFRTRVDCAVCGTRPTITATTMSSEAEAPCSVASQASHVPTITCVDLAQRLAMPASPSVILDVRNSTQFGICHLPSSQNFPLSRLLQGDRPELSQECQVFVLCRRGIDSQDAVRLLLENSALSGRIFHVQGGLLSWAKNVDSSFPQY